MDQSKKINMEESMVNIPLHDATPPASTTPVPNHQNNQSTWVVLDDDLTLGRDTPGPASPGTPYMLSKSMASFSPSAALSPNANLADPMKINPPAFESVLPQLTILHQEISQSHIEDLQAPRLTTTSVFTANVTSEDEGNHDDEDDCKSDASDGIVIGEAAHAATYDNLKMLQENWIPAHVEEILEESRYSTQTDQTTTLGETQEPEIALAPPSAATIDEERVQGVANEDAPADIVTREAESPAVEESQNASEEEEQQQPIAIVEEAIITEEQVQELSDLQEVMEESPELPLVSEPMDMEVPQQPIIPALVEASEQITRASSSFNNTEPQQDKLTEESDDDSWISKCLSYGFHKVGTLVTIWAYVALGGQFTLRVIEPLWVSHTLALMLGIYIGRRTAALQTSPCQVDNSTSSNSQTN